MQPKKGIKHKGKEKTKTKIAAIDENSKRYGFFFLFFYCSN